MTSPLQARLSHAYAVAADPQQSTRYPAFRACSSFLSRCSTSAAFGAGRWQRSPWNPSAASLRCCPRPALVQDFRALSPLSQPSLLPGSPWKQLSVTVA